MYLWIALGLFFLLLGGIGVVLPLLPTTPFVLLAAACFARSSPRLHGWLLHSELFGPMLKDWERNQCVSRKVKTLSISMMALVGGTSIWFFVPPGWPQLAGLGLVGLGCVTVLRLKTCPNPISREDCMDTEDRATQEPFVEEKVASPADCQDQA